MRKGIYNEEQETLSMENTNIFKLKEKLCNLNETNDIMQGLWVLGRGFWDGAVGLGDRVWHRKQVHIFKYSLSKIKFENDKGPKWIFF